MENNKSIENLSRKDRREIERQRKKENFKEEANNIATKKITRYVLATTVSFLVIFGITWLIMTPSKRPNLPPTTMQGHIENNPTAHILVEPMQDVIQRHMLEHADGKGKPGIIIQYNCQKYTCESDFITKLTNLVKEYPDSVYLAPGSYDGKLILTKLGSIKILEKFDDQAIRDFIGL